MDLGGGGFLAFLVAGLPREGLWGGIRCRLVLEVEEELGLEVLERFPSASIDARVY